MTGPDIESPAELEPEIRGDLRDLILVLADSKRVLGIRYSDWVLGAPELEAGIAASSIAQDEWGHSRILYALLKDFEEEPDRIEHKREASGYHNMEILDRPLDTWAEFVVANAIADTALTTQIGALTATRYAALRKRVEKQLDEERFHFGHGAAWFQRLAKASDAAHEALQEALDAVWSPVLHWFGPPDHGEHLVAEGLCDATGEEARGRFLERVTPLIDEAGLDLDDDVELDFSGWDAARRRFSEGGPDEDALERVRGDRNRAFLMD